MEDSGQIYDRRVGYLISFVVCGISYYFMKKYQLDDMFFEWVLEEKV